MFLGVNTQRKLSPSADQSIAIFQGEWNASN
jgi:hypothetical protein